MNIYSSLVSELKDKAYRDAYVASQIRMGLPFQARALRHAKGWTQGELADAAGMAQPRIAEIEKPGKRRFNLETLLRIASAFDVGLEVRFVPISEIIDHNERFDPDAFSIPSFAEELALAEEQERKRQERSRLTHALTPMLLARSTHLTAVPSQPSQLKLALAGGVTLDEASPLPVNLRLVASASNAGTFVPLINSSSERYGAQRQTA